MSRGGLAAIILSITALVVGSNYPTANSEVASALGYDTVAHTSAAIFVMTTNRLTVTSHDPGKIYVETGADSSSPVSQYIYVGGQNGAPTDPTQPAAWLKVGDLSSVDLSAYSTTDQMNTAIANAISDAQQSWVTNQNDRTTEDSTATE